MDTKDKNINDNTNNLNIDIETFNNARKESSVKVRKVRTAEEKKSHVLFSLLAVITICLVANVTLTSLLLIKGGFGNGGANDVYGNYEDKENVYGETRENDVIIADEYTIRSTTAISDAYKTGDVSKLSKRDKETLQLASLVLDEIIKDGMTDFEKEKAVYEWMVTNLSNDNGAFSVIPTTSADAGTPYGVLKSHCGVCVGYATTFRLFMEMMNIPCMVEHNTECYHSWNLVKLGDNWYITDIYSDMGKANYAHFNITDTMYSDYETWDKSFFPAATSFEYNYSFMNAKDSKDVFALPGIIRKALDEKESFISIKYSGKNADKDMVMGITMLDTISPKLYNTDNYGEVYIEYSSTQVDEDTNLLTININRPEKEEDPAYTEDTISEENLQKMQDAVDAAFGDLVSTAPSYEDLWDDYEEGKE
ncbi:MAG: transglutaminase-like domain-containing protein [Lachnospiraceae bacterium]|nr:transglutaminase-like domain-containing protein [Lachnospiraceae bacterium]